MFNAKSGFLSKKFMLFGIEKFVFSFRVQRIIFAITVSQKHAALKKVPLHIGMVVQEKRATWYYCNLSVAYV